MTTFEKNKLTQIVLYILRKTGGMDYYHLFKILYFAERSHLVKWGTTMCGDSFCALKYGPVPTQLYDAIKRDKSYGEELIDLLYDAVDIAGEDAPTVLLAKKEPDMDYISQAAKEAIDASINENLHLSFDQLYRKSHDSAWEESFYGHSKRNMISPVSMAKAEHADESTLNYIQEQLELEEAMA